MLTSLWIIVIVALFNVFIYYFFVKMSMMSENRLLWNKAQIILRNPEVHLPKSWKKANLLKEFAEPDSLIRIIAPDHTVQNVVCTNEDLLLHPAVFRPDYYWVSEKRNGQRMVFIQVPIIEKGTQVGQLELGKALNVLGDYVNVLAASLTLTSAGILLFSVVGGFFYTRFIFRPIRELLTTMQNIQKKGSFARLDPELTMKNDELGRLGLTFNEMMDRLEENDRKQKQFVADASHELRTPLTVIESYAGLLKRWGSGDPRIREEALEAITSETSRLKTLTGELLQLAETEKDSEPQKRPVLLKPLLTSVIHSLRLAFQRRIDLIGVSDDLVIHADPAQIRQLMIILLDNAVKYSSEDVKVFVSEKEKTVAIQVSDRGIGIPEEDLPHIFERFYRVDKARSRRTGGTGLGLAIAKRIVRLHGGAIQAESRPGEGTAITVTLPKEKTL
jgi:signal transduction histidine kinase